MIVDIKCTGQGYFYQISKGGGHLRLWTFFLTNFGSFEKNCGPFTMPEGSEVQVS